ncbi:LacI family transcriptional regulator [Hymenobacter sp. BT175]|uniref:LacI family DNA-binding transcriptional regulator n=1 Tax=Hymenobacter translucens TaxID=2886507 RepID=UPI001D0E2090|nr:LacI family DNA-binding transcriptional regulator [Hymenobacter translucens]MCC2548697.1 LacI family transcriptional regulator [Hymenobacter translucens]
MPSSARKKAAPDKAASPVSMSDLAKELGVSVTTISRALSDHFSIGPATKKRVLQLAKKRNYQPNHLAAALRKGKSKLIGVIVPHIYGSFFPAVTHGIERAASKAGYSVILCQSHEDVELERQCLETLIGAQVEGILVSLARTAQDLRHFQKVQQRGTPLVFFDRILENAAVNAVVLDDRKGGYVTTRHLLEQGCRRIAHFAGPQQLNIYRNRRQGYLDALEEYGVPANEELIVYCDMTLEDGQQGMKQLLSLRTPPDAVFAAGDFTAMGALHTIRDQLLQVPQDIALAGFSNEAFTYLLEPRITSVNQKGDQMGQAVIQLLLDVVNQQPGQPLQQVVLEPELLVRTSSLAGREPAAPKAKPASRKPAAGRK